MGCVSMKLRSKVVRSFTIDKNTLYLLDKIEEDYILGSKSRLVDRFLRSLAMALMGLHGRGVKEVYVKVFDPQTGESILQKIGEVERN